MLPQRVSARAFLINSYLFDILLVKGLDTNRGRRYIYMREYEPRYVG